MHLVAYYQYWKDSWDENGKGKWCEATFSPLYELTGYGKSQINKWFWDRSRKERASLKAKQLSYPGLIWQITNHKTGEDLTPSVKTICCKPMWRVVKEERAAEGPIISCRLLREKL